jgi:hypothetical protein
MEVSNNMPSEQDKAFAEQARHLARTIRNATEEMEQYIEGISDDELREETNDECERIQT